MKIEVSKLKSKSVDLEDLRSSFLLVICLLFSIHSDILEIDGQLTKSFWYNILSIASLVLYVISHISVYVDRKKTEKEDLK